MQQTILNHRYQLEQKIGEGGMASVYSARDLKLHRRVAVKVLHSQYVNDAGFLGRFAHEAQAAAVLSHPAVINVYDVGQDGTTHYIVMEYVDGENLKTRVNREAPLPVSQSVAIAEAVAYGLDSAHRLGMVHRDIKPQNIMITRDGHVRIADFGIAKSGFSSALTDTGQTFGTADYISPEQAQGKTATAQSDLYSLGVTLFEMLTGQLPFTGDSSVSVAMQHVNSPPPSIRSINPHVPVQLEALIMSVLAKDPQQRPATARDFARTLAQYREMASQQTAFFAPVGAPIDDYTTSPLDVEGTGPRIAPPAPPPRARQNSTTQGCGIFMVGLLLVGIVMGAVLMYGSGILDAQFGLNQPTQPTPLGDPQPIAGLDPATSITPTATPITTPTPTFAPEPIPTQTPLPTSTNTPDPTRQAQAATATANAVTATPTATADATTTPPPPTAEQFAPVPDLVGLTDELARVALAELRLIPVRTEPRFSEGVPAGQVIEQQVPPGTLLRPGQRVTYTLSLGEPLVSVPDLVQTSLNYARGEAERLGLNVQIEREASTRVSEDFVIRQEPRSGARIAKGDTIFLTVSVGNKIAFPSVVGALRSEAEQLLAINGLSIRFVDEQGPDRLIDFYRYQPNEVVSAMVFTSGSETGQPVQNGDFVPPGAEVVLGVRAPTP